MVRAAKAMQAKSRQMIIAQRGTTRTWDIKSPSGKEYIVWAKRNGNLACNCPWGVRNYHNNKVCSHILAVKMHSDDWQHAQRVSFWANEDDAKRQHRPRKRFQDVHMTIRAAA